MIKRLIAVFSLLYALSATAQTVQPILQPHAQFVDQAGNPCALCSLYTYAAGTTTPLATYTDSTGLTQNTNPIILDASGSAQIWTGGNAYKFVLNNALGTTVFTVDNVTGALPSSFTFVSVTATTGTFTNALAQTGFGFRYAKQFGNGISNGISTCASGQNYQTCIADPSYASTEQPTPNSFSATPFHYEDFRLGSQLDFFHNPHVDPSGNIITDQFSSQYPGGQNTTCSFDIQPVGTTSVKQSCMSDYFTDIAPGWSKSSIGWNSVVVHQIASSFWNAGIAESLLVVQHKFGKGDNASLYVYDFGDGGFVTGSDEGSKAIGTNTGEDTNAYVGTANATATGATTVSTTSFYPNNPNQGNVVIPGIGAGQFITDVGACTPYPTSCAAAPFSGTVTSIATGLDGLTAVTLSGTSPPQSSAWGTLTSTVSTPNNTARPFTTPETFNVTVLSGTFVLDGTTPVCFDSVQHEQELPTAVTNGAGPTATLTVPLRNAHNINTYIYQGGGCGYGMEMTAYTQAPNIYPLRYFFDVVGCTSATVCQLVYWQPSGAATIPLSHQIYDFINLAIGCTNGGSGTTVTCTYVAAGSTLAAPNNFQGSTFVLAGNDDSVLNGPCTGVTWTSTTVFTCTRAGISGSHTSGTIATAVLGSKIANPDAAAGTPINTYRMYPAAEILDERNTTVNPPVIDGTNLLLEPNVISTTTGDYMEVTHNISQKWQSISHGLNVYDPFATVFHSTVSLGGAGGSVGNAGSGTSSNSTLQIPGGAPDTNYQGYGGIGLAPNLAASTGAYSNGWILNHMPALSDGAFFNMSDTTAGTQKLNDLNYRFYMFLLNGKSGGVSYWRFKPNTSDTTLFTTGAMAYFATSHTFTGPVAMPSGSTVNGVALTGVANITIVTGTTAIPANTCTANTASTMTGLTTSSAIVPPTPTSSTVAVTGWGSSGGLSFAYYVATNTFNWSVCNSTSASITPGGSINWIVGAR